MLGAPVGVAGIAAANFVLTALFVNALPASSTSITATYVGIGLISSPGLVASASIALPAIGAVSLLYHFLYRRTKASK
ncbi:hypothetical protein BDY19DRAFT_583087 [Irpex rosettiformis]|uniref:Uncharacterized protein n=1 Tax=Irpex rosettiformis TaxID=378272 RepID=A0ACB8UCX1_9APHY|nr:hypothetical protein BDY19DRAFT_583087 [Irpex rosettiformis]